MKNLLKDGIELLKDVFWPQNCLVCNGENNVEVGNVCSFCWGKLLPARNIKAPAGFFSFHVVFAYDDILRQIIHAYKFNDEKVLAVPLGEKFAERLIFMDIKLKDSIIVPVPDHPSRRRERGFNPAEEIAKVVAKNLNVECRPELAKRLIAAPHQSSLPDNERKKALQNAFVFDGPEDVDNQPGLVLLDDVTHTGTTLFRLRQAATKAGWKKIRGICLCA